MYQLLTHGANPNIQDLDFHGWSSLHIAIDGGNPHNVIELLEWGADPDLGSEDNTTALHIATLREDIDNVRILLQFGANKRISTRFGDKAWDLASPKLRKLIPELRA